MTQVNKEGHQKSGVKVSETKGTHLGSETPELGEDGRGEPNAVPMGTLKELRQRHQEHDKPIGGSVDDDYTLESWNDYGKGFQTHNSPRLVSNGDDHRVKELENTSTTHRQMGWKNII